MLALLHANADTRIAVLLLARGDRRIIVSAFRDERQPSASNDVHPSVTTRRGKRPPSGPHMETGTERGGGALRYRRILHPVRREHLGHFREELLRYLTDGLAEYGE